MSIVLKKISKSYDGRAVLKNLNLEINQGEFHVLLGPSGGGKTTTLFVMAGLTKQDSGSVSIDGRDVSNLSPDKRRIGFVFQDHALFPHLTVFDNVAYGLKVRRINGHEMTRKVEYYLSKVSIAKEKGKFPHQLSGGQKQRVALARALVIEPEILLMDEPMSSLDAMTKETVRDELKSIQQEIGVTTVYVTHDQNEAILLGDRVSVLNNGRVEQIESPSELFHHPKTEFVARFVGIKNILKVSLIKINNHEATVQINNDGMEHPFRIRVKKYPVFEKGKKINLCIHPEKITLKREEETYAGDLNRIRGKIVKRTNNGNGFIAIVDIGGTTLHAAISSDFKVHENVWVCFAPDAPHPLCGKKCREPEQRRKCLNNIE
ncbi:MAG: ABC transporter ATP-binding protein [Deltaproteobacteria bacterium]|nr:ABC transporter ATP-binding protein [Deltaproteobacteria bacterium]